MNTVFAGLYLAVGGVARARPGSFADAFFFSVQTLATIGYGEMYPLTLGANLLVTAEAVLGLVVTALATGLVFAKFSIVRPRVVFARVAVITPLEGVPTLMIRVANERGNYIADAAVRLVLLRTERSAEGTVLYRMRDLAPMRERSPAFARGWVVMHAIDEVSPLYGATPGSLRASDAEVLVTLVGVDGTTGQFVHARHSYLDDEIVFGRRYVDQATDGREDPHRPEAVPPRRARRDRPASVGDQRRGHLHLVTVASGRREVALQGETVGGARSGEDDGAVLSRRVQPDLQRGVPIGADAPRPAWAAMQYAQRGRRGERQRSDATCSSLAQDAVPHRAFPAGCRGVAPLLGRMSGGVGHCPGGDGASAPPTPRSPCGVREPTVV